MRRRDGWLMVGALTTLVVAAVAAACGSFGSDEATGANPDGGGGGGQEAASSDAPVGTEASADAGRCVVLFEEHFTDPFLSAGLLPNGWQRNASGAGVVAGDTTTDNAASPSLRGSAVLTVSTPANAAIERTVLFDGGVDTFDLAFRVKLDEPDGGAAYQEFGCETLFRNSAGDETVAAVARWTGGELAGLVADDFDAGSGLNAPLGMNVDPSWHHVRIVTKGASPTSAVVTYEVDSVAASGTTFAPRLPTNTDRVRVRCGIAYAAVKDGTVAPSSVNVHVDDVVLTRCPP